MAAWELDNVQRRRNSVFITYKSPFKDDLGTERRELRTTQLDREDGESITEWMARVEQRTATDLADLNTVPAELADGDITEAFKVEA